MTKKIGFCLLAIALTFLCVLTACSSSDNETSAPISDGSAETAYENESTHETFYFRTFTSDSVEIIGYEGSDAFHSVTIPSEINGKAVARIGEEAFKDNNAVTSVILPDSVTEIGDYAFAGCDYLTEIKFPAGLVSIGENAFYQCGLTSVTLPESLTTLGKYAFFQCASLTSVTFETTALGSIADATFFGCSKLASVSIPACVETIGDFAFYRCTDLSSVTLPDTVTKIGQYAFSQTAADNAGTIRYPEEAK